MASLWIWWLGTNKSWCSGYSEWPRRNPIFTSRGKLNARASYRICILWICYFSTTVKILVTMCLVTNIWPREKICLSTSISVQCIVSFMILYNFDIFLLTEIKVQRLTGWSTVTFLAGTQRNSSLWSLWKTPHRDRSNNRCTNPTQSRKSAPTLQKNKSLMQKR